MYFILFYTVNFNHQYVMYTVIYVTGPNWRAASRDAAGAQRAGASGEAACGHCVLPVTQSDQQSEADTSLPGTHLCMGNLVIYKTSSKVLELLRL